MSSLVRGVESNDRALVARAITLIESRRDSDRELAQEVLQQLLARTGNAIRVGITGVPGVGKSTFIEALGMRLIERGHRVAVLAVDPTSSISGGSILGDKSRMGALAQAANAFIRPSPSARTLGGVAARTREAGLLLEAAGYDVVLIETVGVGQSETEVDEMTDFFLALMLPGGGDELQGIKKGLVELADLVCVNKADGERLEEAQRTAGEYRAALRYLRAKSPHWQPTSMTVSALDGTGIDAVWEAVLEHRAAMQASGALLERRRSQLLSWVEGLVRERVREEFESAPGVAATREKTRDLLLNGQLTALQAATRILRAGNG